MAKKYQVLVVDDFDGSDIPEGEAQELRFAVNGNEYRMDLGKKNMDKFTREISKWTEKAEKVKSRRGAPRTQTRADVEQLKAVREWANKNGHAVSSRGRIPARVMEAFEAKTA